MEIIKLTVVIIIILGIQTIFLKFISRKNKCQNLESGKQEVGDQEAVLDDLTVSTEAYLEKTDDFLDA